MKVAGQERYPPVPTVPLRLACAGVVRPTPRRMGRRMEVRGKGIERESLDRWAAVLPGEGEQRRVQPLTGVGDLVCLGSCLTSAELSAVPRLPSTAAPLRRVMLG